MIPTLAACDQRVKSSRVSRSSLGLLAATVLLLVFAAGSVPANSFCRRVLLIGNSLTTANDLPRMVGQLSEASGAPICASVVAFNGFSLSDHWDRGRALASIRRGGWDAVVLQQGPSSLAESRAQLVSDTRRFDAEIRRAHGRTALFMVWPPKSRAAFSDAVSGSYAEAAAAVGGLLLPAGDAWRAAWSLDPELTLYGPDRFHPSPLGSLLAAMVISRGLTGRPAPNTAVALVPGHALAPGVWRTLLTASETAWTRTPRAQPDPARFRGPSALSP